MPDTLFPFEDSRRLLAAYIDELRKQGAQYTDETKPVFYNEGYITTGDEEAAWQEVKPHLIRTYSVYQEWSHFPPDTTGTTTERDRDYTKTLDVEEVLIRTVRPRMLLGSPDDCISRVAELEKELGMNHILFRIHHHGLRHRRVMEQIKLLGEKVIPYFEDRDRK
jgi:alkanesulfonate monooxygenase SsuD/methylene tetrahydromethanopterin reductase-like flavin-dependent oxidoreductase (luciferase family)